MEIKRKYLPSNIVLSNTDEDAEALSIRMALKLKFLEKHQADLLKGYNRVVVGPTFIYATIDYLTWDEFSK